jgi:adenosylcobinamide-GDP ribazoletransferase
MPAVRAALAATTFLTRVPLARRLQLGADDVVRGSALFPLVGAAIGASSGLAAALAVHVLPPLAAGGLALSAGAILTGALHLDGLADTADGLGGRSREHALEIMRDHRIGSFGAVALTCNLIVRASIIGALASAGAAVAALAAAGACSRAVPPVLAAALPYARPDAAPSSLAGGWSWARGISASAAAVLIAALLLGASGVAASGAVAFVALVLGLFFRRWLGGLTGDCLGAAVEVTETLALAVVLASR